jgi:large subunit ribosomal protein L31
MKTGLHPEFNTQVKVTCACGNAFVTGSTVNEIYTEICSNCHPFYTGKQKLIDATGNVDRFKKRVAAASQTTKTVKKPRKTRTAPKA